MSGVILSNFSAMPKSKITSNLVTNKLRGVRISLFFMGSDEFARVILERLQSDSLFEILGVVVPPDAPVGRRAVLTPCPVKQFGLNVGLSIFEDPESLKGREMDFLVVASYGRILKRPILELPRYVALNVHPSLLPLYRGASPIQSALLNGEVVSGVTIMQMISRMDAGPIYAFSEVAIRTDHNAENLRTEMARCGAELLAQTIPGIFEGSIESKNQNENQATYCTKMDRLSGEIDWNHDSAIEVERKWKAYFAWPGIYTTFKGKRLKLLSGHSGGGDENGQAGKVMRLSEGSIGIQTRKGILILKEVQMEGKSPISVQEFVRGQPDFIGSILT